MAEQVGVPIYMDTSSLSAVARDLRLAAPKAWAEAKVALRAAGEVIASDARQRAGYSSRIPGSIQVRTNRGNVKVRAGGEAAPEAAALENKGRGNPRHPLFGDREHWYTNTNTPAFLTPALDANRDQVAEMILDAVTNAVTRALREHG